MRVNCGRNKIMLYPSSNRKEVSIANVSSLTCLGCRSLLAKERTTVLTYEIIVTSQSRAMFSTFSSSFFFLLHRQQQESSSLTKQEREKRQGNFYFFPGLHCWDTPCFYVLLKNLIPNCCQSYDNIDNFPKIDKRKPPKHEKMPLNSLPDTPSQCDLQLLEITKRNEQN